MKRAVIVINGELSSFKRELIRKDDLLVAVDGGLRRILRLGLKPDLVIGDMDSVPKSELKKSFTVVVDNDEDRTDLEAAIDYVVKKGFKQIVVVGFLGRRIDHMVSGLMALSGQLRRFKAVKIVEGNQEIYLVKNELEIKGKKGDLVSLVPLRGNCSGVSTRGLKYVLNEAILKLNKSRGVSNVMLGKKAVVEVGSGLLMVVLTQI